MEQLSDNPLDLLAAPGQISGLGLARKDQGKPKVRLFDRHFPGRCDIWLSFDEAQQLAEALRAASQDAQATWVSDSIGPVGVGIARFNATQRRVVTIIVNNFPGELRFYISDPDAQRIANELEKSIQRAPESFPGSSDVPAE